MTPRLRAEVEGGIEDCWKRRGQCGGDSLASCWGVPIKRYSVLEGLEVSLLAVNQEWRVSRSAVRVERGGERVGQEGRRCRVGYHRCRDGSWWRIGKKVETMGRCKE